MKFSIIIPVYNTEKYLSCCIESVLSQTYTYYEIIIINDGSTDNSKDILENYKSNLKIRIIEQTNHGLSYTRNIGVKYATGDYILFLDSDDLIEKDLLQKLNDIITDEDLIKFSYEELKMGLQVVSDTIEFKSLDGHTALKTLIESKTLFEMAWLYAYKKEYMNKYEFTVGKYHEDFGLIPIMINNASKVTSINYPGYIYNRENESSITAYTNEEKEFKKAMDTLYFFKKAKENETDEYLLSFYSNGVLLRSKNLKGKYKKEYLKEVKKEKVYNYILTDTLKRKIKKILYKMKFLVIN